MPVKTLPLPGGKTETGKRIREFFALDVAREIEKAKRYGSFFSLLFIDLDNLHSINERYGNQAGSAVIKKIADMLRQNTRLGDTVYHLTQDKFIIFLPNTRLLDAGAAARKLLSIIRNTRAVPQPREAFDLTASIGVVFLDSRADETVDELFRRGEELTAAIKESGKNRVAFFKDREERSVEFLDKPPERRESKQQRMVIKGTPISHGIGSGRAVIYKDILSDETAYYQIKDEEVESELLRINEAMGHVQRDINKMERQVRQNLGREYSDIFLVHRTILNDISLLSEMEERLRSERKNAEQIVRSVFRRFENRLVASSSEAIREKSLDIADVSRRVLRRLTGAERNIFARLPRNSIIVAKSLLPSESVHLRRGNVKAIITEKGSRNSHAAILARGLGIPYISETELPIEYIKPATPLIVDADRGEIIVNPTKEEKNEVFSLIETQQRQKSAAIQKYRHLKLEKDGRVYKVMANINSRYNVQTSLEYGSDGIGLYRIEQIYMQSSTFPTREQIYRYLADLFAPVKGQEITVRLLDIGGDKTLPYITMKDDTYSFLGVRGVRFLLRYPRVLEAQLWAFLKLSEHYNLKILIPMVTLASEIDRVRQYLEKTKQAMTVHHIPFNPAVALGAMVEVPAAVLRIEEIVDKSDIVSIGTNDLIQYIMASSRENASLMQYYEAGTGLVMHYIEKTVRAARRKNIECSLCGEIAADTDYTARLLSLGLTRFSVSPSNIPRLKEAIAKEIGVKIS